MFKRFRDLWAKASMPRDDHSFEAEKKELHSRELSGSQLVSILPSITLVKQISDASGSVLDTLQISIQGLSLKECYDFCEATLNLAEKKSDSTDKKVDQRELVSRGYV